MIVQTQYFDLCYTNIRILYFCLDAAENRVSVIKFVRAKNCNLLLPRGMNLSDFTKVNEVSDTFLSHGWMSKLCQMRLTHSASSSKRFLPDKTQSSVQPIQLPSIHTWIVNDLEYDSFSVTVKVSHLSSQLQQCMTLV